MKKAAAIASVRWPLLFYFASFKLENFSHGNFNVPKFSF